MIAHVNFPRHRWRNIRAANALRNSPRRSSSAPTSSACSSTARKCSGSSARCLQNSRTSDRPQTAATWPRTTRPPSNSTNPPRPNRNPPNVHDMFEGNLSKTLDCTKAHEELIAYRPATDAGRLSSATASDPSCATSGCLIWELRRQRHLSSRSGSLEQRMQRCRVLADCAVRGFCRGSSLLRPFPRESELKVPIRKADFRRALRAVAVWLQNHDRLAAALKCLIA